MDKQLDMLRLKIENFRAIKKADIRLNGITLVAGENGSGKSTISKILHYLFKIVNHYDEIVYDNLAKKLSRIIRMLEGTLDDEMREKLYYLKKNFKDENIRGNLIDIIKQIPTMDIQNHRRHDMAIYRLQRIMFEYFEEFDGEMNLEKISSRLEKIITEYYEDAENEIQNRDKKLFQSKLSNIFKEGLNNFSVLEYGDFIITNAYQKLGRFLSISNSIYVDSPMAVEHPYYDGRWADRNLSFNIFSHWKDLNYYLKKRNISHLEEIRDTHIFSEIKSIFKSEEILDGEVYYESSTERLMYKRDNKQKGDEQEFQLIDCATGVKSIAILQMLYINGWLSDETLLILDEPEAHLHPQWIVEYARLIVLLNKKVGVKFFIASHNPDMVSAIQDISDQEDNNDKLKFYLSKEKDNPHTYIFEDKGLSVEDIFDSFNKAIGRINDGGNDE